VKPIFESHEMKATFDEYLQDWAKPTTSFFLQLSVSILLSICDDTLIDDNDNDNDVIEIE